MKHLSVLSFRECYSAPRQIRLHLRQPRSPRAHPSAKKIEREDFLENFKAANRINSLEGFSLLSNFFLFFFSFLMFLLFLEGCCEDAIFVHVYAYMCGRKGWSRVGIYSPVCRCVKDARMLSFTSLMMRGSLVEQGSKPPPSHTHTRTHCNSCPLIITHFVTFI